MESKILVSIVMITYHHELYIEKAIKGVLKQECNFNLELIIADDNSPDRTEEIVKSIIEKNNSTCEIKYTKHKVNKGIEGNFKWALLQARGEYIAICEGDDYWIAPQKLKKQVEFLKGNNDYVLVCTEKNKFIESTKEYVETLKNNSILTYNFEDIIIKSEISTLTVLFRRSVVNQYFDFFEHKITPTPCLDYCLWMFFSLKGKVAKLNITTAVYRVLTDSATHSSLVNYEKQWKLKKQYWDTFVILKREFQQLDQDLMKCAEYLRVKSNYLLSLLANDESYKYNFIKIFKKNNDWFRYLLLRFLPKNKAVIQVLFKFELKYRTFITQIKFLK